MNETVCVIESEGLLRISHAVPCDGFLLLTNASENMLVKESVLLLFGAAASLYALVFVFKLLLKQLGF